MLIWFWGPQILFFHYICIVWLLNCVSINFFSKLYFYISHQPFTYLSHVCPFNVVSHCPLSWFFGAMCKNSTDSHCISSKPFDLICKDICWFCYLFILLLTSRIIRILYLHAISRQTCGPGNLLSDWSWHVNCLLVGTVC